MENKDRRQEQEEMQQQDLGPSRGGETGEESPVLGIPTTPAHEHDGVEGSLATAEPRNNTGDNGANDDDDGEEEEDDEASEFEFAFASNLPTITAADEIFSDGRIRPIYPVFDRGLFFYYQSHQPAAGATAEEGEEDHQQQESIPVRVPLRDLIMQQQQRSSTTASTSEAAKSTRTSVDGASTSAVRLARASSFSSSDADDLEGVPAGTYCVWTPGSVPPSPEHLGKKSRSTGSTGIRRWSLRDLVLGRSHSDGRQKLMFFQHEGGEQAAGEAKSGSHHLEEEQAKGKKNKDKKSAEHNKEEDEKKNKNRQGKNSTSSSKDHPKGASTTAPTHRKKKPAAATELDLATAHRLYYSNEALKTAGGGTDSPGRRRSLTFLPYRKDLFVGIFPHARRPGRGGVGSGFPQPPSSSFYGF